MRPTTLVRACLALALAGQAGVAQAQVAYFPSDIPGSVRSEAVQVADVLYLSPFLGIPPGQTRLADGLEAQTRAAFDNVAAVLKRRGLGFDSVFRCVAMMTDTADAGRVAAFNRVYLSYFKPERLPVRTFFGVGDLPQSAQIELECTAYNPARR